MVDTPHQLVLGEDAALAFSSENLEGPLSLLADMRSYGTNLIVRCYATSSKDLQAHVGLLVLLKHFVAIVDSLHILLSKCALYASQIELRALYEAHLNLMWLLEPDSSDKAVHYLVWAKRRERDAIALLVERSPDNARLMESLAKLPIQESEEEKSRAQQEGAQELATLRSFLSKEPYAAVAEQFEQLRNGRPYDPNWYVLSGIRNLRKAADRLGSGAEYTLFYTQLSDIAHASAPSEMLTDDGRGLVIEPIRNPVGIDRTLRWTVTLMLRVFRRVLEVYRPAECDAFLTKYRAEWRARFKSIPVVEGSCNRIDLFG